MTKGKKRTERDRDVQRKRELRGEAARITIPEVVNPSRRESCLDDPEKFLLTYFRDRYTIKFGEHHYRMMDTLISRAKYGGRQAVAAPRGCGKSEVFKGILLYLVLAGLIRFPLLGAATAKLAKRLYQDFRTKIATNDLLLEDFPEVCYPVRALEGAPQRASKQHVNGKLTGIVWTANDYLRLPDVPGDANEYMRSKGWDWSPYGGVKVSYFGLDSAFRGYNIDGDRPDFVPIDDPETRESAKSYEQGVDRQEILEKDVSGLVSQEGNIAIAVLTTVQNCYCMSYRLTDPKIVPAFNGLRYGMITEWPKQMDMWGQYIALRHKGQSEGDEFGQEAVAYYLENFETMNEGVEMLSDHYNEITLDEGKQLVHSAIQQAFNKIADTSLDAYKTEYQNDPVVDDSAKQPELTSAIVANRLNDLKQNELPNDGDCRITLGLDLGDHYGHWAKIAWFGNAIGCVIDYGVMEVPGYIKGSERKAKEVAIHKALLDFFSYAEKSNPPEFAFIDSGDGDHTAAVYGAIFEHGSPVWQASKGDAQSKFRMPVVNESNHNTKRAFDECHAKRQDNGVWLYHVNGEHWKHWVHNRFLTSTWNQEQLTVGVRQLNDGSMSLFSDDDARRHHDISKHMVAEMRQERFEEGKGWVRKWIVKSPNSHWLDAVAYACAAAGCLGIKLIQQDAIEPMQIKVKPIENKQRDRFTMPGGRPFLARR